MMVDIVNQGIRGKIPFDTVIANAKVVNVFTEEILPMDVGIISGKFGYLSPAGSEELLGDDHLDAEGAYMVPGFIDCHLHIESSMLTPPNFAEAVLPFGTTTAIIDPHEIANVLGIPGIMYMLESSENLPLDILIQIPSCVPAVCGLDTSGAQIDAKQVADLWQLPRIIGLGEVMDFPGVIEQSQRMVEMIAGAKSHDKIISGHAPMVTGRSLAAYLAAGPDSCHELMELDEVMEKLRMGMVIEGRRSSHSENVSLLAKALQKLSTLPPNTTLCTDDLLPNDLLRRGHMNEVVRYAIQCQIPPARAIRIATLHGANRFHLWDRGAIAPGRRADFCLLDEIASCKPHMVFTKGRQVANNGKLLNPLTSATYPAEQLNTVKIPTLSERDFQLTTDRACDQVSVNGMTVGRAPLLTKHETFQLPVKHGEVLLPERGICLAVVIERHGKHGSLGKTLIEGLNLQSGAVGTTISHDSHNLLIVGKNPQDMLIAAQELAKVGGGVIYVNNHSVKALLPLPVAGLMSTERVSTLGPKLDHLQNTLRIAGINQADPLMAFLTLALPVIPEVRITDQGLVDVVNQKILPLYE